jgi:hypothetical protein
MISGYIGKKSDELDNAMVQFAFAYDKQNDDDYKLFTEAVKSGRIKAASSE